MFEQVQHFDVNDDTLRRINDVRMIPFRLNMFRQRIPMGVCHTNPSHRVKRALHDVVSRRCYSHDECKNHLQLSAMVILV